MTPCLHVRGVSHHYAGRTILNDVNFDVAEESIVAVIGPSGVGKTTLLRLIGGFEAPDRGRIEIAGEVVAENGRLIVAPQERHVTIVPQDGALFSHLSVGGNVAFGLQNRRSQAVRDRVREVLEIVGLAGMERQRPSQLSGGMQQRVALARALAPRPRMVLLDEPFAALDAGLREQVREETIRALRMSRATAVWVTHDQEEALSTADSVAVMVGGRIEQVANPATLYQHPISQTVAEFVGDFVAIDGVVAADGFSVNCVLGDALPLAERRSAGPARVLVRPEQLTITEASRGTAPMAKVVSTKFFGHDGLVEGRFSDGQRIVIRLQADKLPVVGSSVYVSARGKLHAFTL